MYQIPNLLKYENLSHGVSTKSEGNMSFSFGESKEVLKDRQDFLAVLNLTLNSCVAISVEHKEKIVYVDHKDKRRGMKSLEDVIFCDGLITNKAGVNLFLMIADCLAVIVFDKVKNVVCLLHLGWRNSTRGFVKKAIKKIKDDFNSSPSDLIVGIGPSIHKESYIFDDPVQKNVREWRPFLEKHKNGGICVDLVGFNIKQMIDSHVLRENIFVSGINTAKNEKFYSHYRDSKRGKNEGRFACVAGLSG